MELWQSAILGLVQGLGEFLPISSSAHLILVPQILHFPDPGLAFDAVLHLGTLTALLLFFWKDWAKIIRNGFGKLLISNSKVQMGKSDYYLKSKTDTLFFWWILVATIPGALAGFFLESQAETVFRSPELIAVTLTGFGVVLWAAQRFAKKKKLNFISAVIIGLAQAFAIIPGVSRSGATMSAAMFLGLSKFEAARFSFLLATPIVLGAGIFSLKDINDFADPNLAAGFLVSAITGFLAIKFLLKWISKISYTPFVIYRLLLTILIILFVIFK
jgi:undecaprenyl-diphosphatase